MYGALYPYSYFAGTVAPTEKVNVWEGLALFAYKISIVVCRPRWVFVSKAAKEFI